MTKELKPFSLFFFLWSNLLTLALIFLFYKFFFPNLWQQQLNSSLFSLAVCFIGGHLVYAYVEYFFHRYVLHTNAFKIFNHFYTQHNTHHNHTDVEIIDTQYKNDYPIMRMEQLEASFFPWYAYLLFAIAFTPIILGLAIMTNWPVIIAGYCSLLLTVSLYEFFHQLFHKPLSWWQPLLESNAGKVWRRIYAFHLDHHLHPSCNESVSGFFGIPIADLSFGTYQYSGEIYKNRSEAKIKPDTPRPYLLVRVLDKLFTHIKT